MNNQGVPRENELLNRRNVALASGFAGFEGNPPYGVVPLFFGRARERGKEEV